MLFCLSFSNSINDDDLLFDSYFFALMTPSMSIIESGINNSKSRQKNIMTPWRIKDNFQESWVPTQ
jgi:hypothetical protein